MTEGVYFLGIDGGGTGCRARVIDASGKIYGLGQAGPASLRLGADAAWASLMSAASAALGEAGLDAADTSVHAAAGIAGLSRKGAMTALQSKPHVFASMTIVSDALAACMGAHGGADGGVVIAGTGSIGLGIAGGREFRAGGYGFPVSDAGGGAWLGLEALRWALRAHDERVAKSALTAEILERFENDPSEVVGWMDRATATDYASFAPMVVHHANQGDAVAVQLMQAAAAAIGEMVTALFEHGAPRVALLGGFAPSIQPRLSPSMHDRLVTPQGDAVDGALLLARKAASK